MNQLKDSTNRRASPSKTSGHSLSGGPRRLLRAGLAAPFVLFVLLGPSRLVMEWTGLSQSASVVLLLVIFAAGLWITEAIPLYVTSLAIVFLEVAWLLPIMERESLSATSATFLAPFFSNVILLFLGGFALSTAFRRYYLDRAIAEIVLARTKGEPRAVLLAVILVTGFLSMWMSNTAAAAMMLGLTLPLGEKSAQDDPLRKALPLAVAVGANLGGLGTPIGTPPNAIVMDAIARTEVEVTFLDWMLMAGPLLLSFLLFAWWLLLRMHPPRRGRIVIESDSTLALTPRSWIVAGTTVVTGVLWLTSGLHSLPTGVVALVPVILFFGSRVLDRKDFQNLPWDVLILAGGGLSLGAAVEVSGLGEALVARLPISSWGVLEATLAVGVVAGTMTTFMSNTAAANLLVPLVAGLSVASTTPLLMVLAYACSCTMILPVSTPPNTMVFSSGQITPRDLVRFGLVISFVALLATAVIGPHYWNLFLK